MMIDISNTTVFLVISVCFGFIFSVMSYVNRPFLDRIAHMYNDASGSVELHMQYSSELRRITTLFIKLHGFVN